MANSLSSFISGMTGLMGSSGKYFCGSMKSSSNLSGDSSSNSLGGESGKYFFESTCTSSTYYLGGESGKYFLVSYSMAKAC